MNAGLDLTCNGVYLHKCIDIFIYVKDLNTSSTSVNMEVSIPGPLVHRNLIPCVLTEQFVPLNYIPCLSCSSAATASRQGKVVDLCL